MYSVYDNIPFGVLVVDTNNILKYLNNRACDTLAIRKDSIGENINEIYDIDIITKHIYSVEIGETKFFNVMINPILFLDITIIKNDVETVLYISDVSERQENLGSETNYLESIAGELASKVNIIDVLRRREKDNLIRLESIINNISEGLIVLDEVGRFSFYNKSFNDFFNMDKIQFEYLKDLNTHDRYDIFDEERNVKIDFKHELVNIVEEELSVKNRLIVFKKRETDEKKYFEFSSVPIYDTDNKLKNILLTLRDITLIKENELKIQEQWKLIREVVDSIDLPISVYGCKEDTILLANKYFNDNIWLQNQTNIYNNQGKNYLKILKSLLGEDNTKAILKCLNTGNEYVLAPYKVETEEGEAKYFKVHFMPTFNSDNTMDKVYIHAPDITEETNHRIELENITKLKNEFFTIISHELRTPITIIYSAIQLARDIHKDEMTENVDRLLIRINQNASRLLKLTNNILDLSKATAGFLKVNNSLFNIVYETEEIVTSSNSYSASKGIDLIFDTNEEEVYVNMDIEKYEKVLLNLISNAIKFTQRGKSIFVCVKKQGNDVKIIVKDEGCGIPEDKIEYIFDRFTQVDGVFTRQAEGTGLGLSVVREFVNVMGGTVSVKSEEGVGTEFVLEFKGIVTNDYDNEIDKDKFVIDITNKVNIEFSDI